MSVKKRGRIFASLKSQVSLFMIIAIAVLLVGIIYFAYQKQSAESANEFVQPELAPIKSYVEDCMSKIAVDGLERIGLSGGYIEVPDQIGKNPKAFLSAFPGSDFKIPYWWHDGIDSAPPEDYINMQLSNYIKSELKACLNNFEPFRQVYEINPQKEPEVKVAFNDEDTAVTLSYPLAVIGKSGDFSANIENFKYTVPIRFKKVYELAKLIMERENKDYFLERKTIDLMSMDSEIPTTDIEVRCTTRSWQLENIRQKLKELLNFNLPYIRIQGTDYNPSLYVPNPNGKSVYSDTYYQQHYVWQIDQSPGNKYTSMKVAFIYDNWPVQIYARPSENGILKSDAEKGTEMLKFLCLHVWHFTYDLDYPVLATIFDEPAGKNQKYQFNFAFQVKINHNQPDRLNKGTTLFETVDASSEEYCKNTRNQISIFTINNATGDDLRDVNLTFVCGKFACNIGQSDYLSYGAAAGINVRLPYCVYGVLKGSKDGFADTQKFIQTDVEGRSYLLFMNPLKEFLNYKVVKHLLSNPADKQELSPSEKATIYISSNETSFEWFSYYPQEADFPLKLPAGKDDTYQVTVYISDGDNLVGGYIGSLKLSKEQIDNAKEIIFHAVVQNTATEDERALFAAGLESYSKNVPAPELK